MRIDVVDVEVDERGMEPMAHYATDYLARQGRVYVMNLVTDSWQSLIGRIMNASHGRGSIDILQIHSHGTPGTMFSGRLNEGNAHLLAPVFGALAPFFAPGGDVFLKGCTTGQSPRLLVPLADAFGVRVTAGVQEQFAGGPITDVYVGRTVSALPGSQVMHLDMPDIPR